MSKREMNTGKYENGSSVRIFVNGEMVAGQQNCTLDMSSSTIDCSTKESGLYEEFEVAGLGWSISLDGLVPLQDDAFDILEEAWENTEIVELHIGKTGKYKKGNAVIENLSLNSPMKEKSKFSCSLKGCGAFQRVSTEPSPGPTLAKAKIVNK